ncbi:uncharacterized protein LOC119830970 [Zerene cesonia]|uniref:uncharacterized protein LOC119830970 n=1 Tax=Zerene cesonia TaxID=33412 RepID=UPI0018E4F4D6|nr:uncharacterized protein LOC119830970 [Zerene cesonia]
MTNYTILKTENLPESLKNKPKWMVCVICTAALIVMIMSAIAVGVFIGYTYCYVEHQSGLNAGNITHSADIQIFREDTPEEVYKRTINGASKLFISKIMNIGHNLWENQGFVEVNTIRV